MSNIDRLFGGSNACTGERNFPEGMVMAIVKRIGEKHWEVWDESTLNEGAGFLQSCRRQNESSAIEGASTRQDTNCIGRQAYGCHQVRPRFRWSSISRAQDRMRGPEDREGSFQRFLAESSRRP